MVMATGIVSIAAHLLGLPFLARALFGLNLAFYAVLWALTILRVVRHPRAVAADVLHHGRSVGFFTIVAATCVLGSQCLIVGEAPRAALVLWIAGTAFFFTLNYALFTILTVKREKPSLVEGLNGGWLLGVVATQSVAVLGAQIAGVEGFPAAGLIFFSLVAWFAGCMLYVWIISLIFYRYTFFVLSPSDLTPPYWVNMGAAAISTLAGALLAKAGPLSPIVADLLPFVKGLTLLCWATATWWIPMLLVLGTWRHIYSRFPIRYDPLYWGAVFPLGMYTVSTFRLAGALDAPFLLAIPRVGVYVALAAWAAAFAGLVRSLLNAVVLGPRGSP
jgi:tellurite resistance protein TehA-like permease